MVHPTMYASQWFITLFSYSLPFDVVLRIWDIFFLEARFAKRRRHDLSRRPALHVPLAFAARRPAGGYDLAAAAVQP